MHRRTLLASVASLGTTVPASGCISKVVGEPSSFDRSKTVTVSEVERRPPAEPSNLDEDEQPTGLEIDVSLPEAEITRTSTARVSVTYRNTDEKTLALNINPEAPDPLRSDGIDPGLILLSEAYEPSRSGDDCWKPTQKEFPQFKVAYQHPIEPGTSATLAYDVWAAPEQGPECIQLGDYEFSPLYGSFTMSVTANSSNMEKARTRNQALHCALNHDIFPKDRAHRIQKEYEYMNLSPTAQDFFTKTLAQEARYQHEDTNRAPPEFEYTDVVTNYRISYEGETYILGTWSGEGCTIRN